MFTTDFSFPVEAFVTEFDVCKLQGVNYYDTFEDAAIAAMAELKAQRQVARRYGYSGQHSVKVYGVNWDPDTGRRAEKPMAELTVF